MASLDVPELSRRTFLAHAGQGLLATSLAGAALSPASAQAASLAQNGVLPRSLTPQPPLPLPPTSAATEQQHGPAPTPQPPSQRVGFAVVGLGNLALAQIIPAFGESKNARLAAVVSGDRAKAAQVAAEHGVPPSGIYDYKTYDRLRDNPDVEVIYVVLPNSLHREYTVRGAQAGKHILCEKPMATNPAECEEMIQACRKAGKKLMVAYRIQYEPHNRLVQQWTRTQKYGLVKFIEGVNGQNQGDPRQWRQNKALAGGGSLPDVGLYCLNTFRFLTGEEPIEVFGRTYSTPGDPRFREVEENCVWQMRFPSGILANCASGYGFHENRRYRVNAETGWYGLDPAFSYEGLQMQASHAEGKIERRETPLLPVKNQFALELDHMAECVRMDKTPYTPGEEGLQDHCIMAAIYQSAREGRPIALPAVPGLDPFRGKDSYETLQG